MKLSPGLNVKYISIFLGKLDFWLKASNRLFFVHAIKNSMKTFLPLLEGSFKKILKISIEELTPKPHFRYLG